MGGVKVELVWLAAFPMEARAFPERAKAAEASLEEKRREFMAREDSHAERAGRARGWGWVEVVEEESSRGASPMSMGYRKAASEASSVRIRILASISFQCEQ